MNLVSSFYYFFLVLNSKLIFDNFFWALQKTLQNITPKKMKLKSHRKWKHKTLQIDNSHKKKLQTIHIQQLSLYIHHPIDSSIKDIFFCWKWISHARKKEPFSRSKFRQITLMNVFHCQFFTFNFFFNFYLMKIIFLLGCAGLWISENTRNLLLQRLG